MMDLEHIMQEAGLRPSPVKVMVMRVLHCADRPLSAAEIETRLETVDRSSIGRTLAALAQKDIVHTIDDGTGSMKYEMCRCHGDHHEVHDDIHPHFHCLRCRQTFCFEGIDIPAIPLPEGFTAEDVNYVVKGICPDCQHKC